MYFWIPGCSKGTMEQIRCRGFEGMAGGLALMCRKDVDVSLLSFSLKHIDAEVVLPGKNIKWRFTGFYVFPEQLRYHSWDLLRTLSSRSVLPWVVGGDFNEIMSNDEKSGGLVRAPGLMNAFREGLLVCDLTDLGFEGCKFTRSNNRVDHFTVRCRLDRCCGNSSWKEYAPSAFVEYLNFPGLDHVLILLRIRGRVGGQWSRSRRPWRFNAHWVGNKDCKEILRASWEAAATPE